MAKKTRPPEGSVEAQIADLEKGKAMFQTIVQALSAAGPAVAPVVFDSDRYSHLSADPKRDQNGVYVRLLDIHEQDYFSNFVQTIGEKRYHNPLVMLEMVYLAACAFDGSKLFDKEDPKVVELLVAESDFTRDIFFEAMYLNGYYEDSSKALPKNSNGTLNGASESDSPRNSESLSGDYLPDQTLSPQKNGQSTEPTTESNQTKEPPS